MTPPDWRVEALTDDRDGTVAVNGVKGFLSFGDLRVLFAAATEVEPTGTIIEIGSWMGLSAVVMADALKRRGAKTARIVCVDTWRGSPEHKGSALLANDGLYRQFVHNVTAAGAAEIITSVRGASVDVAAQWPDQSADLIWIDGDHSYEAVTADIAAWWRVVKPTGRILGHDAAPESGVQRALESFARRRSLAFTVTLPPNAYYIWELSINKPRAAR